MMTDFILITNFLKFQSRMLYTIEEPEEEEEEKFDLYLKSLWKKCQNKNSEIKGLSHVISKLVKTYSDCIERNLILTRKCLKKNLTDEELEKVVEIDDILKKMKRCLNAFFIRKRDEMNSLTFLLGRIRRTCVGHQPTTYSCLILERLQNF